MSFTRLLHERCKHPMDDDEQRLCYKAQGRAFAKVRGVPVPELIQERTPLAGLVEPDLDRFVVKPNRGCSGRAIVLAVRQPDGTYHNLMGPRAGGQHPPRTFAGWREWCRAEMKHYANKPERAFADEWIIEAMAGSGRGVPDAYGVWCVRGAAFFVRQQRFGHHRSGPRTHAATWDREWCRITQAVRRTSTRREVELPRPRHGQLIIEYAERLSRDWPGPFVRVDFLEGDDGPVFIECTPRPAGGKISLNELWDSVMGDAWEAPEVVHG